MKIYHFALLFLIFFLAVFIKTDMSEGKLKALVNERQEILDNLDSAASDAVNCLAASGTYGTDAVNKDEVISTFFTSLYTSMGIISDVDAQKETEMYIPVILLCDSDGFYVYYYDEYKAADGRTYSERIWSEKMPYYYEDSYFVYRFTLTDTVCIYDKNSLLNTPQKTLELDYHEIQMDASYADFRANHSDSILLNNESYEAVKKGAIISRLENVLSYYTSRYNSIARNNGITYTFSFPAGQEGEWAQYVDDVNLLVVFQGYPYGADKTYTINNVAAAGANIIKKPLYFVEKKGWYYLAHEGDCSKLAVSTTVLDQTFDSIDECTKIGAYCDDCIKNGARIPDLN